MRQQHTRDRAWHKSKVVNWRPYRLPIGKVTPNAIGVMIGWTERYTDQRDG